MKGLKPHLLLLPRYPYHKVEAPIKLDQNESAHDLPPHLKERALKRLAALSWNRYPSLHAEEVREALARHTGWDPEGVVVSPGSNLLIQCLAQAATRVLDTAPAFPHYAISARLAGTPYQAIPLHTDFRLPLAELLEAMSGEAGVLFLPNPHAPTGVLFPEAEIQALARRAGETGWLLVIDEAYQQFSGSDFRDLARGHPHLALLRTFSKAWGLGGIRAGYLLASPTVAGVIQNLLPPFGLPAHTAAILLTVLEDPSYIQARVREVEAERERLYRALRQHPTWRVYPSHTNFLLVRTPDAAQAYRALLERGILVRRQDHYAGLEGCIRLSVGTPAENDRLLEAAFEITRVGHA
ncbi:MULTISPECIES: histidinol-phosphate transaminase [unclassified Meiothermus]|uniref:histidinol-phosphate transaminase n=1 Tax=unclassified Meiothermus TaxID=370471 RepID=UPI000D7C12F8|nr:MULTISPECIES: histidinol-phosphate transaminase [unclassified Meiothermus]PZA06726.1 histidinol-phosphate transaminase [Meiothermus sp. Pnk-1]RYM36652.1 histidinol-phosphate transaminase [Meiothermus sp. PNK-Is4]